MSWLILSVRGLVALFLGVSVLIASWGQDRLATFIGVYFILAGAQALRYVGAASARSRVRIRRVAGIVAIVFAVLVITRETLAGAIPQHLVLTLLGLATIAIGLMRLAGGFSEEDPRATDQAWRRPPVTDVGLGIAELVLGVALIVGDRGGIRPAVAVWGLVSGTALLVDARRARRDRTQPLGGAGAQTDGVGPPMATRQATGHRPSTEAARVTKLPAWVKELRPEPGALRQDAVAAIPDAIGASRLLG